MVIDKSLSVKFWNPLISAYVSVFATKRNNTVELKICGEYEDESGIIVYERCMTIYPSIDDLKQLKQLLEKVIQQC